MSSSSPPVEKSRLGDIAAPFADGLSRGTPGAAGVDADAVLSFLQEAEAAGLELHSLMLHRDGHVVAEAWWWPYRSQYGHIMHSLAKSFTAAAIGIALDEGRFKLTDKVVSFFPEFLPPVVDEKLAAMTVEDLLTMRTGHAEETSGSIWRGINASWIAEFFKIPVVHQPGAVFVYTSAASYMLSAILTRTTGATLHDYLKPRLLEPLGITDEHWDIGPDGINPGGNGLTCRTADILKFGVLHAQKGMWNGHRLLPEQWVEVSTRPYGDSEYGYHWVVERGGDYRALGVFVQMVMVYPRQGATLAVTSGIQGGSKRILPLLHKHFPKAFRDAPFENAKADAALKAKLESVAEPRKLHSATSSLPQTISGRPYHAEPNPLGIREVRFEFSGPDCAFHLTDAEGEYAVKMGLGHWVEGVTSMPGRELHHGYRLLNARCVAAAAWRDGQTLEMTWIFVETAFQDTLVCRFDGPRVTIDRSVNANSGALCQPTLTAVSSGS